MRNIITQVFAVLLIVGSITGAVLWEFYFDDRINTIPVFQAASSVPRGHTMTKADLVPLRVKINAVPDGAVTEISSILHHETTTPLNKGMILVKDFLEKPGIMARDGQMITPIPNQWIYSLPGSLRRKDKVFVYEYPVTAALPRQSASHEPVLKNITVAFAKDSANQEVKASDEKRQRIDATGNISQLELILSPEEFRLLESKALSGYKFIITYR